MNLSLTARPDSIGFGGIFDIEGKIEMVASLEGQMGAADFWRARQRAEGVSREARELKRDRKSVV